MKDNTNNTTTSQDKFANTQNYKVNIEDVYNSFIRQIDMVRSNVSVSKNAAQIKNFINSLSATNPSTATLLSQLVIDSSTPQESRCHAFYRMLGLPSFESGGSFYSPGLIHATVNQTNHNSINLDETKINVAKNITSDLYGLMNNREIIINNFRQIFSVSDINASVLALSGSKIRPKFNVLNSTGTPDPFDTSVVNQTHAFDNTTNLYGDLDFLGNENGYQDSNGNFPTGQVLGYLKHRPHLIKPFMVDPRVELTINPPYVGSPSNRDNSSICKIIGAPFPLDKSQHMYVENIYASSPMIETICRARLSVSNPTSNLSARLKSIVQYIENTDIEKDPVLLKQIFANPTQAQEDAVLLKYINIMRSMMDALFDATNTIRDTENQYHWVPIPDTRGPEFGSTTQGIIIGDLSNSIIDMAIVTKIVTDEVNQISGQTTTNNAPDFGNFIDFEKTQASPDDTTTKSFGDRNQNISETMVAQRKAQTDKANTALRHIEIIMGEFSGFGLCDILATYLALWTIDKTDLVNMLDDGSFNRLYQDATLQSEAVQKRYANGGSVTNPIDVTMTNYELQVINIYALLDKLWLDRQHNSGIAS